jgi:hypothetical protein
MENARPVDGAYTNGIAAAEAALSGPPKPSAHGLEPKRQARIFDKGVCVLDTITPPQCEFDLKTTPRNVVTAGKPVSILNYMAPIDVTTATASWSTSARLAAKQKSQEAPKTAEELVP